MKENQIPKILFVGGGSGGHLSIIKGLIDHLRANRYEIDGRVMVVGSKLGMIHDSGISLDQKIIPTFNVPYDFIRGGKLHRALRLQTVKLVWGVVPGFFDSWKILKNFKPDIVFATGGYIIVPMVIAAKILKIKVVLHEQTMTAGLANKIASNFADKIFTTFEESGSYYPAKKTINTGNIIRKEILNDEIDSVKFPDLVKLVEESKREGRKIIYITGGSLGAHKINQAILDDFDKYLEKYALIWQTGDNHFHNDYRKIQEQMKNYDSKSNKSVFLTTFVKEEIGYILRNCDFVICRPGANTLYELAVLNKKAILVPLWVTSKNDQQKNADWYVNNFSGEIIKQTDFIFKNVDEALNRIKDKIIKEKIIKYKGVEEKIIGELRKICT